MLKMWILRLLTRNKGFLLTVSLLVFIIVLIHPGFKTNQIITLNHNNNDVKDNQAEAILMPITNHSGIITPVDPTVYQHSYISSFTRFNVSQANIKFLKNFKTPCFLEEFTKDDGYSGNRMIHSPMYGKKGCFRNGILSGHMSYIKLPNMDNRYRLRCLPQFMLLGSAKSGTTDFSMRIGIHPLVFRGMSKELYWWDQYRFVLNSTLSDYSDMLDKGVAEILKHPSSDSDDVIQPYYPAVIGEFTSITINDVAYWREDPRNIGLKEPKYLTPHDVYAFNPNVKLILILREPTSRLYSHYNMFRSRFNPTPQDFHMRVVNSIEWWKKCITILPVRGCVYGSPPEMPPVEHTLSSWWPSNHNYSGCIRDGLYFFFIKDWLSVFPRESLLIIRSEEYNKDKLSVMNEQVFPFLGVPKVDGNAAYHIEHMRNAFGRHYNPMLAETRQLLQEFYQKYNEQLAELLGDNKWTWDDVH